jgi:hypothetical protein
MVYRVNRDPVIDDNRVLRVDRMRVTTLSPDFAGIGASATHGYVAGGNTPPPTHSNVIQRFAFASDGNSSDVGDLVQGLMQAAPSNSSTHGYTAGGSQIPSTVEDDIQKYAFASSSDASDVGDLVEARFEGMSGNQSLTHGYKCGGRDNIPSGNVLDTIERYPFSSDTNASDVGELTFARRLPALGCTSSENHGYAVSGRDTPGPTVYNVIDKFPFSASTNATDVGDLTQAGHSASTSVSQTHGYAAGRRTDPSSVKDTIDKFSFATDGNATDVGNISVSKANCAGISSSGHGYVAGGSTGSYINVIDKFPFSSDANSSDVGDLLEENRNACGNQG